MGTVTTQPHEDHFDLCVIGSGSGNSIIDERFDGQRIALVDKGVFGGTCLNVGCIPTKMFVLPADLAASPAEAARLGVDLRFDSVRWQQIRDRIFGRIDPISAGGLAWREQSRNVTVLRDQAQFVAAKTLQVGERMITADSFVLAAGSRAVVPQVDGIDQVTVHTSDTVMRLDVLPATMIIWGGGFVAAEFAHIFGSFGTDVTMVCRSERLLRREDADISSRFAEEIADKVQVLLASNPIRFERLDGDRVRAVVSGPEGEVTVDADVLLVATGRDPNADLLALDATGVAVADDGYVEVDAYQRTNVAGIFALGDICSRHQLKHVANHEMRVVQHNLLNPGAMITSDHRFIPHAVFTDPQIAAVGLTEEEANEQGVDYVAVKQEYGSVAYGWALEDTSHFLKLLADPSSGRLIGAHIIGPQASTLIQPLIQAMHFGLDARTMATGQYWIHPALPELIENALLSLPGGSDPCTPRQRALP